MSDNQISNEPDQIRMTRMYLDLQERIERLERIVVSSDKIIRLQIYVICMLMIMIAVLASYYIFQN